MRLFFLNYSICCKLINICFYIQWVLFSKQILLTFNVTSNWSIHFIIWIVLFLWRIKTETVLETGSNRTLTILTPSPPPIRVHKGRKGGEIGHLRCPWLHKPHFCKETALPRGHLRCRLHPVILNPLGFTVALVDGRAGCHVVVDPGPVDDDCSDGALACPTALVASPAQLQLPTRPEPAVLRRVSTLHHHPSIRSSVRCEL